MHSGALDPIRVCGDYDIGAEFSRCQEKLAGWRSRGTRSQGAWKALGVGGATATALAPSRWRACFLLHPKGLCPSRPSPGGHMVVGRSRQGGRNSVERGGTATVLDPSQWCPCGGRQAAPEAFAPAVRARLHAVADVVGARTEEALQDRPPRRLDHLWRGLVVVCSPVRSDV